LLLKTITEDPISDIDCIDKWQNIYGLECGNFVLEHHPESPEFSAGFIKKFINITHLTHRSHQKDILKVLKNLESLSITLNDDLNKFFTAIQYLKKLKLLSLDFSRKNDFKREDIIEVLSLCTVHCVDLNSLSIEIPKLKDHYGYLSELFTLLRKFKKLHYFNFDAIGLDSRIINYSKQLNLIKSLEILRFKVSRFNPITKQNINESIFPDNPKIVIFRSDELMFIRKI